MSSLYKYIVYTIILGIVSYYAYSAYGPVKEFPTNQEVAQLLKVEGDSIQGIYTIAEKYRYIAYTKNDTAYLSYWKFHERKWQELASYAGHEMMLWTLKDGSQFVTWNLKGKNMKTLNILGLQDRNYHISTLENGESKQMYFPQIALKHSVDIDSSSSYGVFEIPTDWQQALQQRPFEDSFFDFVLIGQTAYFNWQVLDENGEVVGTIRPNGTSSSFNFSDDSSIDFMMEFMPFVEDENEMPLDEIEEDVAE